MDYGYDYTGQYSNQGANQDYGQNYGQPYGQDYGQPYGQDYGQGYGQPYGQDYGQSYGQDYGQNYGQPYGQDYGQNYGQDSQYNQNIYGQQMYDGRRFSGYTIAQIKQGLREFVMNYYGKPIRREVTMESYPMPEENSQSNYGNMRHACADRGVCYLEPSIFYIPNMDLEVVYYYCGACNTFYYRKAQPAMEAQQRRETLRYNNTLIKQQEREQTRMMKEYNRNLVRNYKAMEREQNRMWKEQLRMYNRKSY